jgi:DNA-directed RNA polymerase III subunit RPC4
VTAATQPSFLQHVVYLDRKEKRLCVLGEINRRFVVTPDIESLLAEMDLPDDPPDVKVPGGTEAMDTT